MKTEMMWILVFIMMAAGMFVRSFCVAAYKMSLRGLIREASGADIDRGRDWRWRYYMLDRVDDDQMMRQFWRPLRSFWPDMSFTDPMAENPARRLIER